MKNPTGGEINSSQKSPNFNDTTYQPDGVSPLAGIFSKDKVKKMSMDAFKLQDSIKKMMDRFK